MFNSTRDLRKILITVLIEDLTADQIRLRTGIGKARTKEILDRLVAGGFITRCNNRTYVSGLLDVVFTGKRWKILPTFTLDS